MNRMDGGGSVERTWFIRVAEGESQIPCRYHRLKRRILRFTVQLEIFYVDRWLPVVRYDNAHGFCHRDTLHPDGSQDKTRIFVGDVNETFTYAINDLRTNWEAQRTRYLKEMTQ